MGSKFNPGDRVIVEINSAEVYEGNIGYFSPNSIELYDIYCQTNDKKYEGNLTFFRNEILNVYTMESGKKSSDTIEPVKKIKMHPDEFARLKQMTFDFIFVDVFGKHYDDAVEVLSNRESVAVVGLGNNFDRGKPLSVLVMADFKQVYIFDMFCLVSLKKVREILESEFIVKVVHDGGALFDCLYHRYEVEMNNVFDTQIVDSRISEREEGTKVKRNIAECLAHHFNFPLALLSAAVDDANSRIWQERPIIRSDKIKAALLATYVLSLRDLLMQNILSDYTVSIKSHYDKFKKMSNIEFVTKNIEKD